jgi:hypothetical protein
MAGSIGTPLTADEHVSIACNVIDHAEVQVATQAVGDRVHTG